MDLCKQLAVLQAELTAMNPFSELEFCRIMATANGMFAALILDTARSALETQQADNRKLWERNQELEGELSRDKQLVPLDQFCQRCDQPWRFWNGERYQCWQCGIE
jgi:hypothetical protein